MRKKKLLFIPIVIIVLLIAVFFLLFRQHQEIESVTVDGFKIQFQQNISFNQGEHSFYIEEIADLIPELFYIDEEEVIHPIIELSEKTFLINIASLDEDAPMPDIHYVKVDTESEYVLFNDITFTEAGTFNYRIFITIEDDLNSWVFDQSEFLIEVYITEDDSQLKAEVIIEDELIFINEYQFDIIDSLNESIERIQEETRQAEQMVEQQIREQNQATNNSNVITPMFIQGILLVNKHHPLPRTWNPGEDPRAGAQVRLLINEMRSLNFDICTSFSGFRSWDRQQTLFNNFAAQHGIAEAERFSARPGHSEHQTGLAFDLRHTNGNLVTRAPEANWLAANAHRFGFIVRYPANSEHITGFIHEPWHIRYIGARAEEIWRSGLTLEEFLGAGPAPTYRR